LLGNARLLARWDPIPLTHVVVEALNPGDEILGVLGGSDRVPRDFDIDRAGVRERFGSLLRRTALTLGANRIAIQLPPAMAKS
jgi:hypothetical protein